MAPIHHHFELKGWAEPKIIVRFWIIAIIPWAGRDQHVEVEMTPKGQLRRSVMS